MTLLAPGPLAAATDDARADARPARGLDPRAPRGAGSRGPAGAGRPTSGGDGVDGDVTQGRGRVDRRPRWTARGRSSRRRAGALPELEVTWMARDDETEPKTSPEELLAAAHASCFAMQLASGLVGAGWEPEEMQVECAVSFELGIGITQSALTARVDRRRAHRRADPRDRRAREGHVPGLAARSPGSRSRSTCPTSSLDDEDEEAEEHGVVRPSYAAPLPGRVPLAAAMSSLEQLVEELERSYHEAQDRMSDPAVYNDHREAEEVGRRLKKLEAPYRLAQAWRQARDDLAAAQGDPELAEIVARLRGRGRAARGGAEALARRERPRRREGRDRRGAPGRRRRRGGALGGRPGADARALRRAPRLQVGGARGQPERRRRASRKASSR